MKKRVLVNAVKPDMVVAENVLSSDKQLIVPAGTSLTTKDIAKLKSNSIFAIKIQVPDEGDSENPTAPGQKPDSQDKPARKESVAEKPVQDKSSPPAGNEQTYFDRIQNSVEFTYFQDAFVGSVEDLSDSLNDVVNKNSKVDVPNLLAEVDAIIAQSRTPFHLLNMLQCMRGSDDLTYVHSMNVALISHVIGEWMGLPKEELNVLTLAGLLHDIGKLHIPAEILSKPGKLTEEEFNLIHFHPKFGHEIVKTKHLDPRVALVTIQHHERIDGSGYPAGLKGDKMETFSKIVAIADVYDAMTANRVYRDGLCPFTVMAAFEKERHYYDPSILYMFLQRIAQAYANVDVMMSNGVKGKIILINRDIPSKPVVLGEDGVTYDLKKTKGVEIQAIL